MAINLTHGTRFMSRNLQTSATLVAALGCVFASTAQAQITFNPTPETTLNLFGTVDYSIAYQDKNGGPGNAYAPTNQSWTGINGGGDSTNKFGLKGEYAKEAYTVGFEFAGTVSTNAGTAGNSQPSLGLFNERFNFYLKHKTGTYLVGEQMDPAWLATIRGDNRGAPQSLDPIAGVWSVAQGTQASPQTDMKPTNSLGYTNKFGSTSIGLLYKPYANQNTDSAGSQASFGATYDDGTFLATVGYMNHHGIGGTATTNIDIENQSIAFGYRVGSWGVKGGVMLSNSPVGIATGTSVFSGWNASAGPLNVASAIEVDHLGFDLKTDEKNKVNVTIYAVKDRLNSNNTANWLVIGDYYKIDKNLTVYANLGSVSAGSAANPLTAGTGPNNVAKPNDTTTQINTGFTFSF